MKLHQVLIYEALDKEFENIISSEGALKDEIDEIKLRFKNVRSSSYSYFRLESLRYSFVKTTCAENINIIHGLIIDEEINFYPYELIDSSDLIDKTGIESLKALEHIDLNREINENTIIEFMKSKDPKIIRDMVNAVIDFKLGRRNICIVDSMDNFVKFLGAIQRAFPITLSRNITFTTCEELKSNGEFIVNFSSYGSGSENSYKFDLLREVKAVIDRKYRYSELVEIGYYASYQTLKNFHRFLKDFNYNDIDGEIDYSYILFVLLNINALSIQGSDINGALVFLLKYCDESSLQGIFERYCRIFSDIVLRLDEKGSEILSEMVFRAVSTLNNIPSYEEGVKIFFSIIDHLIIDIKADNVNRLFDKHFDESSNNNIFLKYSLSSDRIKYILKILSENNLERKITFYNYIIIKSLWGLGYSWNQALGIDGMEVFLDLSSRQIIESKNDIHEILEASSKSRDIFIHMLFLLYNRASNNYQINFIIERFISTLDEQDEKSSAYIRREIYKLSGGRILIEEFRKRLEDSIGKEAFFKEYLTKVFHTMPDYYNKYFSEAVKIYIYSLDLRDSYKEALSFIDLADENPAVFDRDTLRTVISAFEKGIDFEDIDSIKDYIIKVKKIKRKYDIETHPDMTLLLSFIYTLDDNIEDIKIQEVIEDLDANLDSLNGDKFKKYLRLSIPRIIEYVNSKDDHKIIVSYLFNDGDEGEFIESYISVIEDLLNRDNEAGYRVFMYFIIYYFFYLEVNCRLRGENEIIEKIEESLLKIIVKRGREFSLRLDEDIRKVFEEDGYSIPVKWGQMFLKSMEGRSFKNRLKNIFKK